MPSSGYCLARTTLGTGVRFRVLPPDGQVTVVSNTAIAANLNQPLDVKVDLFSDLPFDSVLVVNNLTDTVHFLFREIIHFGGGVYISLRQNLLAQRASNALDVL